MLNSSAEAANKYFDYAKRINKSVEAERFNKSSTEFHQLRRTTGADIDYLACTEFFRMDGWN